MRCSVGVTPQGLLPVEGAEVSSDVDGVARLRPPSTRSARSVVVDMGARAAVSLLVMVVGVAGGLSCDRDGLTVDYESGCREYVRCAGGQPADRYSCGSGRVFSEVAAACVSTDRQPCVRRTCGRHETAAYAAPGTACRHYYRCENGTAIERACPSGAWFDSERQACTQGAGACYEPLCAGLPDGEYLDASHGCRRRLTCAGGRLRGVLSGGNIPAACPPPRSSSAPLPAGDASFCADEACSSLCKRAADGPHADRTAGCREYFVCDAGRVVRRGACEPGFLFSGQGCEPASSVSCPPAARGPCYGRADGVHRDWRNCSWWFDCRRERVQGRGRCAADRVWDGERCVSEESFPCSPPEPSARCAGRPTGMYQELESDCARYYHCEGGMLTALRCPDGLVFDGARCSSPAEYVCPSLERESCYGKPDGRYSSAESGCRGYYACMDGEKAVYACPSGHHFDGAGCSPTDTACPRDDYSCAALSDGYHAELDSDCRR